MNLLCKPMLGALLSAGIVVLGGCGWHPEPAGPMETMPINVNLGSAERSKMELDLAAGELTLSGGASNLLEGNIEYNIPTWKPDLHVSNIGSSTDIVLKQPERHGFPGAGNHRYKWNLQVNNRVLLDVRINCGAGKQELKLGDTNLRSLTVHIGAGEVNVDLRGHPTRDYNVAVSGGVGHARVLLPSDVGIWAEAHGGIGHIDISGLTKKGDHWENSLYDSAKVNIHVKVEGGIGHIEIHAE